MEPDSGDILPGDNSGDLEYSVLSGSGDFSGFPDFPGTSQTTCEVLQGIAANQAGRKRVHSVQYK